jgi:hypothetical protein
MPPSNGPYLNYAAVCEKVLHEADGVLSLIRIVDRITVTVIVPALPGAQAAPSLIPSAPPISVTFILGLKSGDFIGSVPVKIWIETPTGARWPEYETSASLEGQERGANVILPLQFPVQEEGIYWFVVEVSGETLTRVPLSIDKQVVTQTVPPQHG